MQKNFTIETLSHDTKESKTPGTGTSIPPFVDVHKVAHRRRPSVKSAPGTPATHIVMEERGSSFAPPKTASKVAVVVDPFSTGGMLSVVLSRRGFAVMALWTNECGGNEEHVPAEVKAWRKSIGYLAEVYEPEGGTEAIAAAVKKACGTKTLSTIICGGESGVKVCDALCVYLNFRGNSIANGMENRRDKQIQQDNLRNSGIRAVKGLASTEWEGPVETFVDSQTFPVVVKPVESAGSEGVKLCKSKEDAKAHFHLLMNSQRAIGSVGAAVLVQEFLRGDECAATTLVRRARHRPRPVTLHPRPLPPLRYVCDHVSKDGKHKTIMLWKYDKRLANGSQFVYFGMKPIPLDAPEAQSIIQYTRCAINAIDITNGATHSEIMMTKDGPCLVEVNCRCHGGNGAWMPLSSGLTGGYNQVTAAIDAYVDPKRWAAIPSIPPIPFLAGGLEVMFVSYVEGKVVGCPGYKKIEKLKSFSSMDAAVGVGDNIVKTIDLLTSTGSCILSHPDPKVVEADTAFIRKLEKSNKMFILDGVTPGPERDSGTSDRKSELQWAFEHHGASRKSVRGGSRDSLVDRVNESKMLEAQMKDIYESQISSLHKAVAGAGAVSVLLGAGLVAMAMKK